MDLLLKVCRFLHGAQSIMEMSVVVSRQHARHAVELLYRALLPNGQISSAKNFTMESLGPNACVKNAACPTDAWNHDYATYDHSVILDSNTRHIV